MPATLWLLLAAAVLAWSAPRVAVERAGRLAGVARLATPDAEPGPVVADRAGVLRALPACGAVVVAAAAVTVGFAAALALAAILGCGWLLARDAVVARSGRAAAGELTVGVGVIVGELEAGAQPASALLAAADAAPRHASVFRAAGTAAGEGGDAAEILLADPWTMVLGVAWRVGRDGGTALAEVLRRVAADQRAAAEQQQAVQVALSGPRSSAVLLAGLPLLGIGLGVAMGAAPFDFLLGSPAGRAVGCAGVLLDAGGVLWMRRIVHQAGRT